MAPRMGAETATFTPTEANGKTEVRMTVDVTKLSGVTTVAFEELYVTITDATGPRKVKIAKHSDIGDADQTIVLPKTSGFASDVRRLIQTGGAPALLTASLATGLAGLEIMRRRKR